ncbi:MAG TPA: LysR family transcriptional regulator [Kofleriaceae bacterium]|nr:LysR family transcriptional regulator [Kofleriaceae bacterium]HMG55565.1 LysR family transcriptional regulator [Kofleriaceae bacterium]
MNSAKRGPVLEHLDLNLLVTFEAVYRERNLTRAAKRLFVTQSAVSHGLARLRAQLGDPLFVRRASGVEPTPATVRLAPKVQEVLRLLRRALETDEFDPVRDLGRVRIAIHEELEPAVLPPLERRLRAAVPDVEIECVRVDRISLERDLGSSRLDLAVDAAQVAGPELRHASLAHDQYCVVSRRGTRIDVRRYLAARHVMVSSRRTGPALEDILLGQLGVQRSVVLRCQRHEAACRIVADTDLLLTAPRLRARAIAAQMHLVLLPVPFPLPPFDMRVYWHRQVDTDLRSRWLRSHLTSLGSELGAGRPR